MSGVEQNTKVNASKECNVILPNSTVKNGENPYGQVEWNGVLALRAPAQYANNTSAMTLSLTSGDFVSVNKMAGGEISPHVAVLDAGGYKTVHDPILAAVVMAAAKDILRCNRAVAPTAHEVRDMVNWASALPAGARAMGAR